MSVPQTSELVGDTIRELNIFIYIIIVGVNITAVETLFTSEDPTVAVCLSLDPDIIKQLLGIGVQVNVPLYVGK